MQTSTTPVQPPQMDSRQIVQKQPTQRNNHPRDQAPAAPTSDKPPFSFESPQPRGDGVPKYNERPNELTRDNLKLPANKRLKKNDATASPVNTPPKLPTVAATPPGPKLASPPMPRVEPLLSCPEPACAKKTFSTAEALQSHTEEFHREKDPEDPLAYCLENVRRGLGLDNSGKLANKDSNAKMERSISSQAMKQSASSQGRTPVKVETGTPMSRTATNNASNLGLPRTPQDMATSKSSGPDVTPGKTPGGKGNTSAPPSKEPLTPPPDLWSGVGMSPAELAKCFPSMEKLSATISQYSLVGLTPASTLSSNKSEKNSPKPEPEETLPSDMDVPASSWMPNSFFADTTRDMDVDGMFQNDDIMAFSWDQLFPKEEPQKDKNGKVIRKKKGTVDSPTFDTSLFSASL